MAIDGAGTGRCEWAVLGPAQDRATRTAWWGVGSGGGGRWAAAAVGRRRRWVGGGRRPAAAAWVGRARV
jgi:hypothetical protein